LRKLSLSGNKRSMVRKTERRKPWDWVNVEDYIVFLPGIWNFFCPVERRSGLDRRVFKV